MKNKNRGSGGIYGGIRIPVFVLDIFILTGASALLGLFIFAIISR